MARYRLDPVRETREISERTSKQTLAAAVGEARATAETVAAAERRVAAIDAAIARARGAADGTTVSSGARAALAVVRVREDRYLARLRRDREAALGELARATAAHAGRVGELDAARGRLARARADREVIERHFARWRDETRKRAERRAD